MIIVGGDEFVSTGETLFLPNNGSLDGVTPNSVVYEIFDKKKLKDYKEMTERGVSLALHVSDLRELVYICNLGVKYAVANKEDALGMQKAMDGYLYDTKLLVLIDEEEEIEWVAANEIDGVLFAVEEME